MKVNLYDYVKYTTHNHGTDTGIITYIGKYGYTVLSLKTGDTFSYMTDETLPSQLTKETILATLQHLAITHPEFFI